MAAAIVVQELAYRTAVPSRLVVARGFWAIVAVLVGAAALLQVWIALRVPGAPPGHAVGTLRGVNAPARVLRVLSFFTVQSNLLCGFTSAQLARNPHRDGSVWRPVRLAAVFGITVTGAVYATVLAAIHEPHGWQETAVNDVFHYIVPVMTVIGFVWLGPRPRIDRATVARAMVWPLAWIAYTLVHGAVSKWYPYPFTDVASHGYFAVTVNGVLVLVVLAIVVGLAAIVDQRLAPAPRVTH